MAKGAIAKEQITKKIMEAFGNDFITISDKKIYVWADENGEKVQIAISMTMPKIPLSADAGDTKGTIPVVTTSSGPVVLAAEDEKMVDELMKKLGIED